MRWGGTGKQQKKDKGKAGTLLRLGGYLMHYKWYLTAAFALTIGSNLFALCFFFFQKGNL